YRARAQREEERAQRAVRRDQGAARRLLPDRGAGSRRGALVGGALPGCGARLDRGASSLGDVVMQVLLLMYQDEKRMRNLPKGEAKEVHGAYMAYLGALKEAGVLLANHGLKATPTDAKTVRKASVLNGPFAETK